MAFSPRFRLSWPHVMLSFLRHLPAHFPRLWSAPVLAAVLCSLTSCTGLGRNRVFTGGLVIPGRWNAAKSNLKVLNTAALPNWWQRFHDPVLGQIIAEALRSSPDTRTALSKIAEARAQRGLERANLFPRLDAGLTAQASHTHTRGGGTSSSTLGGQSGSRENYGASLDASWEIDLFGKQRQNIRAASEDLAQAEENYYGAQVTLASEVANAYITLRNAEAELAVVENSLSTREETVRLTKWREEAGTGSALETQQAITTLEQARAAIPTLKQTISQTRNQLALLAGKTPGAMDRLLAKRRPVPAPPARIAIGIPAETLRQRPDVRSAEHGVEAALARTKAAEAERYPSLNLSGTIGIDALKAGRIFSPESTAANIAGSLAAPIFDAGRIRQNINIQDERTRQAMIAWESTVLTALNEVENALIAIQRTAERLEIVNRAVKAAREAATLAFQRYEAGQVDLLNVLDAQRTLLSLEVQQVNTMADQTTAHVQLYRALGGGWGSN